MIYYILLGTVSFTFGVIAAWLLFQSKNNQINKNVNSLLYENKLLSDDLRELILKYNTANEEREKYVMHSKVLESRYQDLNNTLLKTEELLNNALSKLENLQIENISLKTSNANFSLLNEQLKKEREEIYQKSLVEFENIAHKLLENKSNKFTELNKQNIEAILTPLNENIEKFKKQVEETYDKESKTRFSLDERIKELMQQTAKISSEANNLVNALKTNHKKQGDWGEMILESILQKSGLVKNREYRVQNNLVNNEGKNLRPDIIIDLPDNRSIVIDSKVSLNAYDRFCQANLKEEQDLYLQEFIKALRHHIDDLSTKNYNQLVSSLDFTLLFIPIEPAYLLAMQHDSNLWNEAYNKRILLISPTNLIACLKLIVDLWNRDKQDKSAQKIVKQAERTYDKIVLFVKSFEQVGKQLQNAHDTYLKAENQLKSGRGNVLSQTQQLLDYGISPKTNLDSITSFEGFDKNIEK